MRRLVVASGNPGKLREFRDLLCDLRFEVVAQGDLGVASAPETGATFLENALLKARHAAAVTGAAALADDSGLEVDALGGAPGVFSARYAGEGAGDAANMAKLLSSLAGVAPAARTARYRCCLVFVDGPADPRPLIAEATWEGAIATAAHGTAGFGYDPCFWLPARNMSVAQLDAAEKNRLSHRGRALAALHAELAGRAARPGPA